MKDLSGYLESCPSNGGSAVQMRERERERETEHHKTGEEAQTFNPKTFGLPAPMFAKRTRLDNIIVFGKF